MLSSFIVSAATTCAPRDLFHRAGEGLAGLTGRGGRGASAETAPAREGQPGASTLRPLRTSQASRSPPRSSVGFSFGRRRGGRSDNFGERLLLIGRGGPGADQAQTNAAVQGNANISGAYGFQISSLPPPPTPPSPPAQMLLPAARMSRDIAYANVEHQPWSSRKADLFLSLFFFFESQVGPAKASQKY